MCCIQEHYLAELEGKEGRAKRASHLFLFTTALKKHSDHANVSMWYALVPGPYGKALDSGRRAKLGKSQCPSNFTRGHQISKREKNIRPNNQYLLIGYICAPAPSPCKQMPHLRTNRKSQSSRHFILINESKMISLIQLDSRLAL